MPRGYGVGIGVEGQMLLLLLLLQSRRGQLLLLLLLVMMLLPGHVLRVEEHGGGRGGVVLGLGVVGRGPERGLGEGLVGVAARVGGAGRRRRGLQDVGGRGRGRAVVALALLRRVGPGSRCGGCGGGSGGGTQVKGLWLRSEAPLVVRLVVVLLREGWLWRGKK